MDTFIELQLKTGGIIAVSVLLFVLLLAKDHFFTRNRAWLVATLIVPWIVPVLAMPAWLKSLLFKPEEAVQPLVLTMDVPITYGETVATPEPINWMLIGLGVYAVVSLILTVRLIWGYAYIYRLKRKGQHQRYNGFDVVLLKHKGVNPFSFFRTIYLPEHLERDANRQMILEHERNHCAQLHSLDISLAEWLLIIQWWNPFVWWLRKLIAQNHEYCVDNAMVQTTNQPQVYQYSLLNLLKGHKQMQLVNNFNQSLTKKRLVMMNKKHTNKILGWAKGLLVLPFVMAALLAFTNPDKTVVKPADNIEIKDEAGLRKHFAKNIKYPLQARDNGIEGTVTVNFKVDKKGNTGKASIGSISNATVLDKVVVVAYGNSKNGKDKTPASKQELMNLLEEEAKRVVESMPVIIDKALKGKLLQIDFEFKLQEKASDSGRSLAKEWEGRETILTNSKGQEYSLVANKGKLSINGPIANRPLLILDGNELDWSDLSGVDLDKIKSIGKSPAGKNVKSLNKKAVNGAFIIHSEEFLLAKIKDGKGYASTKPSMTIVNGERIEGDINSISPDDIASINVLKGDAAINKYGEKAADGVIEITTKAALKGKETFKSTDKVKIESLSIKDDSGTAPVFIVDGERRAIDNMSAEDIEVVTVLKDPEVTQLYGEGAENGVVLVSTKGDDEAKTLFKSSDKVKISISDFSVTDGNGESPVFYVDGVKQDEPTVAAEDIESVNVMKGEVAIEKYGEEAENGVVIIRTKKEKSLGIKVDGEITLHTTKDDPLYIIDGEKHYGGGEVKAKDIESVNVVKGREAIKKYGDEGKNGVVLIKTKSAKKAEEVIAIGYGTMNKSNMNNLLVREGERAEHVRIRGFSGEKKPHIILDGEEFNGWIHEIDAESIESISVLKDHTAVELYGEKAANGVIIIQSKIK